MTTKQNPKDFYNLSALESFIAKIRTNLADEYQQLITAAIQPGHKPPPPKDISKTNGLSIGITDEELLAAFRTLAALLYTSRDIRDDLKIKHKRGAKQRPRDLDITISSPEFLVAVVYWGGQLGIEKPMTKEQANKDLNGIYAEKHPGKIKDFDIKTTNKYLHHREQSAKDFIASVAKPLLEATSQSLASICGIKIEGNN